MDEAETTGSTDPQTPITVPDDEADEAASHIANMSKGPKFLAVDPSDTDQI